MDKTPHHLLRRSFPRGGSLGGSKPPPYNFDVAKTVKNDDSFANVILT